MDNPALKTSAKDDLAHTSAPLKRICLLFLLITLAIIGLSALSELLPSLMSSHSHYLSASISSTTRSLVLAFALSTICELVWVVFSVGTAAIGLKLSRREHFSYRVLFDGFSCWHTVLLSYLLIALYMIAVTFICSIPYSYILIFFGLVSANITSVSDINALYLPTLLYVLLITFIFSYRYRMLFFVILDHPDYSVRQIISRTKALNKGYRLQIFLLDLSFLPWILLCIITGGILLIWKLPYLSATYAHAYAVLCDFSSERQQKLQELLAERMNHRSF